MIHSVDRAHRRYSLNTSNMRKQLEFNAPGAAKNTHRAEQNRAIPGPQMIVPVLFCLPLLYEDRGVVVGRVQIKTGTETSLFVFYRRLQRQDRLKEFAP